MISNPSNKIKTELIDEVVLRLLGLNSGIEIDYQTYYELIKKKLSISRLSGKELPREEDELLREEFKKAKKNKDAGIRFKISKGKTKIITSSSVPQQGVRQRKNTSTFAIVKSTSSELAPKNFQIAQVGNLNEDKKDNFSQIKKTLNSILSILSSRFKFDKKQSELSRKEKESEKRSKGESTLEGFKKGISGIVSLTKKALAPFENIIDKIKRFIFFTLLGRAFNSFLDWMKDKKNQEKFNSFIEFLSDHWPALAGLYILFGTSFGKLVRGLIKSAARMIVALIMNMGKIKSFAKKYKGLVGLGIGVAAFGSGRLAEFLGENKETPESGLIPRDNPDLNGAKENVDKIPQTKVSKLNFGGMIPSFKSGAINPFGAMDFQQGIPITGAGQDNTLIAAKTGEAILTEKDQQDIGKRYVDRLTGQPLNIPQYLSGRKPGSVNIGNLKFSGFGGGFNLGGMIPRFNTGGIVGNKAPKISASDYNSLLAISALESDESQGRADVAQSLYNRLHAANKYKVNFNQSGNSLKNLITAANQYEPTFSNRNDWLNIKDRNSAAIAIMNSAKGKRYKWDLKEAMRQLSATENALKNPLLQAQSQKHVGGRAYFLGVSEQGNMRPGDVLRGKNSNFFSPWHLEGTQYDKERRNIAAPIPSMLIAKQSKGDKKSIKKTPGIWERLGTVFPFMRGGLIGENTGMNISGATADRQLINVAVQPGESKFIFTKQATDRGAVEIANLIQAKLDPNSEAAKRGYRSITPYKTLDSGMGGVMNLPPIVAGDGEMNRPRASGLAGGSEVPDFSAVAPGNNRAEYAAIYGLRG